MYMQLFHRSDIWGCMSLELLRMYQWCNLEGKSEVFFSWNIILTKLSLKTPRYPTQHLDLYTHVLKGHCRSLHLVSIFFIIHPFPSHSLHFFINVMGSCFPVPSVWGLMVWLPANSGSSCMPKALKLRLVTQLLNCCCSVIIIFFCNL